MQLLCFAWEGLQLLSPHASQMLPQPQAQMAPKWHPHVFQVAPKNAVWGLVLGLFLFSSYSRLKFFPGYGPEASTNSTSIKDRLHRIQQQRQLVVS